MFNRTAPALVAIPHAFGHLNLKIKGQLIHGAVCNQVQMTAHRPKEILGFLELGEFFFREQAKVNEIGNLLHLMDVFRDPVQRLQIAQAALALFDIGFDHIALPALFLMACVAFFQLGFDKVPFSSLEQVRPQLAVQVRSQNRFATQETVFKKGGADGIILAPQFDTFLDRPAGMPHLQVKIPKHIEHRFDQTFQPRGDLAPCQKQQIDIRIRGHGAPAIPPHAQNREIRCALARDHVGAHEFNRCDDQTIGQPGVGPCCRLALEGAGFKRGRNGGAPVFVRLGQDGNQSVTQFGALVDLYDGINVALNRRTVKDRVGGQDQVVRHIDAAQSGARLACVMSL